MTVKAVKLSNRGEHYRNYNHNHDYFTPNDVKCLGFMH